MTVTYTARVATCKGLGCFWPLLFRWRGSVYKFVWHNVLIYVSSYFTISIIYQHALNEEQRTLFEKFCLHCEHYTDLIPISICLGFFVNFVLTRWWAWYVSIPWPDNLAILVSTFLQGPDERLKRRTIMRYVNLSLVLTLRMTSPHVRKRFPTIDHVLQAGFLERHERDLMGNEPKFWVPLAWAASIIATAHKEGRISSGVIAETLVAEINSFRNGCGNLFNYDWMSIPLIYTQTVSLSVYLYFFATLFGRQALDPAKKYEKHETDLVVPIFAFLQFFFYIGYLKVAETIVNPCGEDDDDFELNWLVDRNLQVSYQIVDEMHGKEPKMQQDKYWDVVVPEKLPYTVASKVFDSGPPPSSADSVLLNEKQAQFINMPPESVKEVLVKNNECLDIELDTVNVDDDGFRKESAPMDIAAKLKRSTSSVANFLGSKGSGSMLNYLVKIFGRTESSGDLVSSKPGSSISIATEVELSRSNASIALMNTYQDEVFYMSDVSLSSGFSSKSPPQELLVAKERSILLEKKMLEVHKAEDENSGSSFQTTFFQEHWCPSDDPSDSDISHQKNLTLPTQPIKRKDDTTQRKPLQEGARYPVASSVECDTSDTSDETPIPIIVSSKEPVKHLFSTASIQKKEEDLLENQQNELEESMLPRMSSLSWIMQKSSDKPTNQGEETQKPEIRANIPVPMSSLSLGLLRNSDKPVLSITDTELLDDQQFKIEESLYPRISSLTCSIQKSSEKPILYPTKEEDNPESEESETTAFPRMRSLTGSLQKISEEQTLSPTKQKDITESEESEATAFSRMSSLTCTLQKISKEPTLSPTKEEDIAESEEFEATASPRISSLICSLQTISEEQILNPTTKEDHPESEESEPKAIPKMCSLTCSLRKISEEPILSSTKEEDIAESEESETTPFKRMNSLICSLQKISEERIVSPISKEDHPESEESEAKAFPRMSRLTCSLQKISEEPSLSSTKEEDIAESEESETTFFPRMSSLTCSLQNISKNETLSPTKDDLPENEESKETAFSRLSSLTRSLQKISEEPTLSLTKGDYQEIEESEELTFPGTRSLSCSLQKISEEPTLRHTREGLPESGESEETDFLRMSSSSQKVSEKYFNKGTEPSENQQIKTTENLSLSMSSLSCTLHKSLDKTVFQVPMVFKEEGMFKDKIPKSPPITILTHATIPEGKPMDMFKTPEKIPVIISPISVNIVQTSMLHEEEVMFNERISATSPITIIPHAITSEVKPTDIPIISEDVTSSSINAIQASTLHEEEPTYSEGIAASAPITIIATTDTKSRIISTVSSDKTSSSSINTDAFLEGESEEGET